MRKYRGAEMQRCFQAGAARLVQSGEERCREIQRCSMGVEMWRCRGVERCSGSAEVNHSHRCRGAGAAKAKVQRRCRIEYMNMSKAGAEVQRCRGAEMQRCRDAEKQRSREEERKRGEEEKKQCKWSSGDFEGMRLRGGRGRSRMCE